MDRAKGLLKGGWHPSGDPTIRKDSWKSDLKGLATGKKNDPNEQAQNHQSTPLSTLKDPDSFGPPPKHSAYYGSTQSPTRTPTAQTPTAPPSLGSAVPKPSASSYQRQQAQEAEEERPPPGPYRVDTTGLRTDNLPKPPVRRGDTPVERVQTPTSASRPVPQPPPRAAAPSAGPPPTLPPRQNEYPDEHTPPPPPSYGEATRASQSSAATLNQGAVNRLGQAGVSVPGFGIGANANSTQPQSPSTQGHPSQLSELQQRFARMSNNSASPADSQAQAQSSNWRQPQTPTSRAVATGVSAISNVAAHKKAPPPPPAKRTAVGTSSQSGQAAPPPVPTSSKPRPT